jgi:hypothetical protein
MVSLNLGTRTSEQIGVGANRIGMVCPYRSRVRPTSHCGAGAREPAILVSAWLLYPNTFSMAFTSDQEKRTSSTIGSSQKPKRQWQIPGISGDGCRVEPITLKLTWIDDRGFKARE